MIEAKFISPRFYFKKLHLFIARAILASGRSLEVCTHVDRYRIKFVASSFLEYSFRARKSYDREQVTMHWLRNVHQEGDTVYDIGANVGAYSLYAGLKNAMGSGKIYAFEPVYANFFSLCRNIEANNLGHTVIPYPLGFGNSMGPNKMYLRSTVPGSALHGLGVAQSEGTKFEAEFEQGIWVTSLDIFCGESQVDFPNHIKIDVDGGEWEIVQGMAVVINDPRLRSIMIEINQALFGDQIEKQILRAGFTITMVEQSGNGDTYNKLFQRS